MNGPFGVLNMMALSASKYEFDYERRLSSIFDMLIENKKKKVAVDTSPVVDVVSIEARLTHPTPAVEPYNIPTSSIVPAPTHAFRPRLTQGMIYKIGNLAHSADVRASRVEVDVLSMIDRIIATALAPIQEELREQ
uniref:Integrase core domain containing protein n=1 Tax=Solanum tuberosum TaxID=4113 RepID=M1DC21_SOLTU